MKKITQKSVTAFLDRKPFKRENTKVYVYPNYAEFTLYGNVIATYYFTDNIIEISNCGWETNTTKERLNALPNVRIQQKKYVWYLNGVAWDGKKTKIKL